MDNEIHPLGQKAFLSLLSSAFDAHLSPALSHPMDKTFRISAIGDPITLLVGTSQMPGPGLAADTSLGFTIRMGILTK